MSNTDERKEQLKARFHRLFTHPSFYYRKDWNKIFAPIPNYDGYLKAKQKVIADGSRFEYPDYLSVCYFEPVLEREQEWHLWRQYNFLKYKAMKSYWRGYLCQAESYDDLSLQLRNQLLLCNVRLGISLSKSYPDPESMFPEAYVLITLITTGE